MTHPHHSQRRWGSQIRRILWAVTAGLMAVGVIIFYSPAVALADDTIRVTLRDHQFHPDVIEIKAGIRVKLLVINEDKTLEEFESPELRQEKKILPGASVTLKLRPLKPGTYNFFGEFHPETAKGRLIVR